MSTVSSLNIQTKFVSNVPPIAPRLLSAKLITFSQSVVTKYLIKSNQGNEKLYGTSFVCGARSSEFGRMTPRNPIYLGSRNSPAVCSLLRPDGYATMDGILSFFCEIVRATRLKAVGRAWLQWTAGLGYDPLSPLMCSLNVIISKEFADFNYIFL